MHCQEVLDLLSAYYDDELGTEVRSQIEVHLESCSRCAVELESFRRLSQSAEQLNHPEPPEAIWNEVEAQLSNDGDAIAIERRGQSTRQKNLLWAASIAALILVSVSLGIFGRHIWFGHNHHELAADFSNYLDAFQESPNDAHLVLVNKYAGKAVNLDSVRDELGYRPALAAGLPEGYTVQTAFVMDMPCCKCIKCLCKRSDGSTLAIFEHDDEQPIWFGDRPSIQTACGGATCTLTQLDGRIAASWKQGPRHFTIVGAKDVEEVAVLIKHLAI